MHPRTKKRLLQALSKHGDFRFLECSVLEKGIFNNNLKLRNDFVTFILFYFFKNHSFVLLAVNKGKNDYFLSYNLHADYKEVAQSKGKSVQDTVTEEKGE